ncbi:hypothetical protein D0437_30250 [Bacillus cereus]|uniref:Uncharacterized protein n=1 Tax=Bacillus cereus TaxID=1396 RepID=A0A9X7QMZ5_BACCE|nr:hypothetical protein D0437_30250 [Bacillus cereus]
MKNNTFTFFMMILVGIIGFLFVPVVHAETEKSFQPNNIFFKLFPFKVAHVLFFSSQFSYSLTPLEKLCNRTWSLIYLYHLLKLKRQANQKQEK